MQLILQMNTGSFKRTAMDAKSVIAALEGFQKKLAFSDVIFGWTLEPEFNRQVVTALKGMGVRSYLWLPVFAEVLWPHKSRPFRFLHHSADASIQLCEGEDFCFVCPSAEANIQLAIETFDSMTDGVQVDGVFVDRMRYPAAGNSTEALLGCWCPECAQQFHQAGIREEELALPDAFVPESLEGTIYHYQNPSVERLFQIKRSMILSAFKTLADAFHQRELTVGLDSFAPCVADYVGQDVQKMAAVSDFIKPMMYRRTNAPAGLPFELGALENTCGPRTRKAIDLLWDSDSSHPDANSPAGFVAQMKAIQSKALIAPGIEINPIAPICDADLAYVEESLKLAGQAGCEKVVLSWDVLRMGQEILDGLSSMAL